MSSLDLALTIVSFVLFGIICVVLIADKAVINDYRARLREARKEIAELKMHDGELRAAMPLLEGRAMMMRAEKEEKDE